MNPPYVNYLVTTRDGRTFTGMIVAETAASLTLRRAEKAEDVVLRNQIESIQATTRSLMPEGLETQLNRQEFRHRLARPCYLACPARVRCPGRPHPVARREHGNRRGRDARRYRARRHYAGRYRARRYRARRYRARRYRARQYRGARPCGDDLRGCGARQGREDRPDHEDRHR